MQIQFDIIRGYQSLGEIKKATEPSISVDKQKAIIKKAESQLGKCRTLEVEITQSEQ